MAVQQSLNYSEYDARIIRNARVGDVIVLGGGQHVRLLKKTNHAVAVETYRWYHAVEDWILEKLGKFLP